MGPGVKFVVRLNSVAHETVKPGRTHFTHGAAKRGVTSSIIWQVVAVPPTI